MRESSKRKWAVSIKHTKQASAVISEIWLGATVKTDHPQHSRLCRSRTANTSPGQHCKGLHRKAVHSFPTITMCFPWSITFCDAPLSRPLSQRALLPVGSSSTSSLVLGGNLTCVESGRKKSASSREASHYLWRTLVLSERLLLWTLQEPLYTYSRIIQVPLQNSLYSYMTTVVSRPIAHHSAWAGPHNQPLPSLALADHPGRYGQTDLKVVSTKETV